ncbi:hypothetical protein BR93DRAFT_965244 [Coniochaeta sp. PMI_546]|nr:hypothetical protein BR93DRAFT_965244 [Coniochaeta sp. PMI_546]
MPQARLRSLDGPTDSSPAEPSMALIVRDEVEHEAETEFGPFKEVEMLVKYHLELQTIVGFARRTVTSFGQMLRTLPLGDAQGMASVNQTLTQWDLATEKYAEKLQKWKAWIDNQNFGDNELHFVFQDITALLRELGFVLKRTRIFLASRTHDELARIAQTMQTLGHNAGSGTEFSVLADQMYKMDINLDNMGDE